MALNLNDVEVTVKRIEGKSAKATVNINFGDFIVKGFRIQESKKKPNPVGDMLWLTAPSYLAHGKYINMFFANPDIWKQIEDKVWSEYYNPKTPSRLVKAEDIVISKEDLPP